MLKVLRKICPLISLALSLACGKELTDPSNDGSSIVNHQELPPVLMLQLKSNLQVYQIPRNANFLLPDRLVVRSGDVSGRTVTVRYNLDAETNDFEFRCFYLGTSGPEMLLDKCLDHYNREVGPIPWNWFPMDQDKHISLQISGNAANEIVVDAFYSVKWK